MHIIKALMTTSQIASNKHIFLMVGALKVKQAQLIS
jgi:hypothetical protein